MPNALSVVQKFFPDVETVKDATRDVRIDVTVADTKARGMKNHKACAMAVACKRKLHLDGAVVSRSIAYLVKDNVATRYRVPESAAREVVAYDRGGTFAPGEYKLQKPDPRHVMKPGAHSGTGKKPGSRPRGAPRHYTANIRTSLVGK